MSFFFKILVYIFKNLASFKIFLKSYTYYVYLNSNPLNLKWEYKNFAKGLEKLKLGGVKKLIKWHIFYIKIPLLRMLMYI